MFRSNHEKDGEKIYRYSIRKYHFGAASVAIAALIFFANAGVARAESVTPATAAESVVSASNDAPPGQASPAKEESQPAAEVEPAAPVETAKADTPQAEPAPAEAVTPAPVASEASPAETVKTPVDKTALTTKLTALKTLVSQAQAKSVETDALGISKIIQDSDQLIEQGEDQAVIDEQVQKLEKAIEEVQAAIQKADAAAQAKLAEKARLEEEKVQAEKATEARANASRQGEKKNQAELDKKADKVGKPVSQPAPTVPSQGDKAEETPSTSSLAKAKEEDSQRNAAKESLRQLASQVAAVLEDIRPIQREGNADIIQKAEAVLQLVDTTLKTAQISLADIDQVYKRVERTRNSVMNASLREQSGKRDRRTGDSLGDRGSGLREGSHYLNATVGWIVKKGETSDYPEGTFLYASHNDNSNNNPRGPEYGRQRVSQVKQQVYVQVTKTGEHQYRWHIVFNDTGRNHQRPYMYFTLPVGHTPTDAYIARNGEVLAHSNNLPDAFFAADKKLNGGIRGLDAQAGDPINHKFYHNSITGKNIVGLQGFLEPSTGPHGYFNRDTMSNSDIRTTDVLWNLIKRNTQTVFSYVAKNTNGRSSNDRYTIDFTTNTTVDADMYYMAGLRSFEYGQDRHYMQWYGVQNRYIGEVANGKTLNGTFLKGTGVGNLKEPSVLFQKGNQLIRLYDTYNNKYENVSSDDIENYELLPYSTGDDKHEHNRWYPAKAEGRVTIKGTGDATPGVHHLIAKGTIKATSSDFKFPVNFRVIEQADIFEPTIPTVTNRVDGSKLGDAKNYITTYTDVAKRNYPDYHTPEDPTPFYAHGAFQGYIGGDTKGLIANDRYPKNAEDIKTNSVTDVEWVGGDTFTGKNEGERSVIEIRLGDETKYMDAPADYLAGQTLTKKQRDKLLAELHEQYGDAVSLADSVTVKAFKKLRITYYDESHKDHDVLFTNFVKQPAPTAPTVSAKDDGSVTVTPKGTADKLFISYTPTSATTETDILARKSNNTWSLAEGTPSGITIDSSTGVVTIAEPTVKDKTEVKATATYLNSDPSSEAKATAKSPDTVEPTIKVEHANLTSKTNGVLTDNADDNVITLYRKERADITFKAWDDFGHVSNFIASRLPQGVWFNQQGNRDVAREGNNVNTENSALRQQTSGTVEANTGTIILTVTATDGTNPVSRKVKVVVKQQSEKPSNNPSLKQGGKVRVPVRGTINDKDVLDQVQNPGSGRPNVLSKPSTNQVGTQNAVVRITYGDNSSENVTVPVEIYDDKAPVVEVNGHTLTPTAPTSPTVTIFRGSVLEIPYKVSDNSGNVVLVYQNDGGIPRGVYFNDDINARANKNATYNSSNPALPNAPKTFTVKGKVADNADLGDKVLSVEASDWPNSGNNQHKELKKLLIRVLDVAGKETATNKNLNDKTGNAKDYFSVTDGSNHTKDFPAGTQFKWKDGNKLVDNLTLDTAGIVRKTAVVVFPQNVAESRNKANVEKEITFLVKPEAPTVATTLDNKGGEKPDIQVTGAAPNSTVTLYSGNTKIGEATANAQGVATVTPTRNLAYDETISATSTKDGVASDKGTGNKAQTVRDTQKPNIEGLQAVYTAYRGEKFTETIHVTDNSGKISRVWNMEPAWQSYHVNPGNGWLTFTAPKLSEDNNATATNKLAVTFSGKVPLRQAVGVQKNNTTLVVSDKRNLFKDAYFKFDIKEQAEKYTPVVDNATPPFVGSALTDSDKTSILGKVKVTDLSDEAKKDTAVNAQGGVAISLVNNGAIVDGTGANANQKVVKVEVKYPDLSTDVVEVLVKQDTQAPELTVPANVLVTREEALPNISAITASDNRPGDSGLADTSVTGLPGKPTVTWQTTPNTQLVGNQTGVALVTYPDGSTDSVTVTVKVKPAVPTVMTDLANQAGKTPEISVTSNAGATVTLYSGDKVIGSAVADSQGIAKITPSEGLTYGAVISAKAGKDSVESDKGTGDKTKTVTDTTAPVIQDIADIEKIQGQSFPDVVLNISDTGGSGLQSVTATGYPNYLTFDENTRTLKLVNGTRLPEGAAPGKYTIIITATDNAGQSTSKTLKVTITESDATKVTPDITPVVKNDQNKPTADDVKNAIKVPSGSDKEITNKDVKGSIPSEVGGPTDVEVEVTYGDGSKETVKVPVTITESDATKVEKSENGAGSTEETLPEFPMDHVPTVDLEQKSNGDVVITPKQPDGTPYPKGTEVEVPGVPGKQVVGDDGKVTIPNDQLPKQDVPGTVTITVPGGKPIEVDKPTTTPAQKHPSVEVVQGQNGDVVITPKQPDGTPYESGTKVTVPGVPGEHEVGKDGKITIPNDKLPKEDVPGKVTITVPGGKPIEVDKPTITPAQKLWAKGEPLQEPALSEFPLDQVPPVHAKGEPWQEPELPEFDGELPSQAGANPMTPQLRPTSQTTRTDHSAPAQDTRKSSKKELPNTGTSESHLSALGILGMLTGLVALAGKKRKKDE